MVLLAVACTETVTPVEEVRFPVEARALYADLWEDVQRCSGLTARFERVSWFVTTTFPEGPSILGQWNERHEITLRVDFQRDPAVIKHEILHDLLDGDPGHSDVGWILCQLPVGVG